MLCVSFVVLLQLLNADMHLVYMDHLSFAGFDINYESITNFLSVQNSCLGPAAENRQLEVVLHRRIADLQPG